MSDNVPVEVQVQFMKRLPVKSLLQFRSVSKRWKSLIDNREFIGGYSVRETQPLRQLVLYTDALRREETYVSLVDDETFVKQKTAPTISVLAKLLMMSFMSRVVGSSHGLLCLYGNYSSYHTGCRSEGTMVVLWNPSIRKSIGILVLDICGGLGTLLGFGVCPITSDPTVVMISVGVAQMMKNHFVSFDMTTHEFRMVDVPDNLACRYSSGDLAIFKVSEALAVLKYNRMGTGGWHVWIMDHGVSNSWTKLVSIDNVPGERIRSLLGFTKRSQPIFERDDVRAGRKSSMFVYEPCSQDINDIRIYGKQDSFFVGCYMESLLLLDQSDGSVYLENSLGPMDCQLINTVETITMKSMVVIPSWNTRSLYLVVKAAEKASLASFNGHGTVSTINLDHT
ncbi:hypothetical protein L1887_06403 [Cichorium endivia]|nr:hypothetical protein L1887_06403 [Cichorium endivia]